MYLRKLIYQYLVFQKYLENDAVWLFDFKAIDTLESDRYRVYRLSDGEMPYDPYFIGESMFGFVVYEDRLEFCSWK